MGRLALRRSQKAAGPREILIRCKTGKAVMTTVLPVGLHSAKTLRVRRWGALNVSIRKAAASFAISTIVKSDDHDQKSSGLQNCS